MADKLIVFSMNAQGLRDRSKREDVFDYLKSKKGHIYFLQDTHFTDEDIKQIYRETGMTVYLSNGNNYARGVATFIDKQIDFKVKSLLKDEEGNMLIINCIIHNKDITLVNIYGPNQDKPEFYDHIRKILNGYNNCCIIAGDFNLVLNPHIDYMDYLHVNNPKARESVITVIQELDLIDCWRDIHVENKEFTWFKKNSNKKARLDFFLISSPLLIYVKQCEILPGYRSDHSLIKLFLEFGTFIKGRSYWKMNNYLLKDSHYI